jgi:hypothetical protein
MQSLVSKMNCKFNEVKLMLEELIMKHSSINKKWDTDPPDLSRFQVRYYEWDELTIEGKKIQTQLFNKYKKLVAMTKLLTNELSKHNLESVDFYAQMVLPYIMQKEDLWQPTKEVYLENAIRALDQQLKMLEEAYEPSPNEYIYIPDTNALLINTNLEAWSFDDVESFTLVILPTVLSELDKLKIDGKKEGLRDKANTLIKRIKEYIRRGDISEGVKLTGKNKIRSIAIEPNFDNTLPWLDPDNKDDRIIAAYFEVVREHPKSNVVLVTADINMQNKAAFASMNFEEPPEFI